MNSLTARHTHQTTSPLKRPLGLTALVSGNSLSEDSSCASSSSASGPTRFGIKFEAEIVGKCLF